MSCDNLIIDGSNIEYRMFYISKKLDPVGDEKNGCVRLFMNTVKSYVQKFEPTHVYVTWDKKLTHPSRNFRDELLNDTYKTQRVKSLDIQEMYDQEPRTIDLLKSLGYKCLFPNILEGDDIVSWLVHTLPGTHIIVSVDNDFYQLINDHTSIFHPGTKKLVNEYNFEEVVPVKKQYFKLYKAIVGDTGDNIDGLDGYGKVKGKKLAENWDTASITPEQRLIVERNLKLIDLDIGYTMHAEEVPAYQRQLEEQKDQKRNVAKYKEFCRKYELFDIMNKADEWTTKISENRVADLINSYFNNK